MISEILFPSKIKCLICGKEIKESNIEFCDSCFISLPHIKGKQCLKCGEPIFSEANFCLFCKKEQPIFTKSFAPFTFQGQIQTLIHELKYNNKKYIANTLSKLIFKKFLESNLKVDVVIPVPLYFAREAKRGFNQAYLLCSEFISNGYIIDNTSVVRSKNTLTQTNLTKTERKENLQDAFKVLRISNIKNKNILLIDDVYTTGSTFNSLAKQLFKCGAKNVYCLTVAHTLLEK